MSQPIQIRAACSGDAASASEVVRRSIQECCADDHRNDDAILSSWLSNKTPEVMASWFLTPANFSLVALIEDKVSGVSIMTRTGKIVLCYVTPEARFSGMGKAMLHALEAQAREWKLLELQVISTLTAADFYRRNGYQQGLPTTSPIGTTAVSFSKRLCNSYQKRVNCQCAA